MIILKKPFPLFLSVLMLYCSPPKETTGSADSNKIETMLKDDGDAALPLERIKLPEGFKIALYAKVPHARSMALGTSGVVYVGARKGETVHAVRDNNGDYKGDEVFEIAKGLNSPNGVAFKDGDLYVAEISRISKYENIEKDLSNPPTALVINDDYPTEGHHGWKYIAFGPDGKLYVPVGAPCNICEPEKEIYASITRINPDGSGREIVARGVRNTVGFTWHPQTGEMWFTDNGRDNMGDDMPPCELNRLTEAGQHFGYPYCHGGDIQDDEFGDKFPCNDFVKPVQNLGAHVAPLGAKFYQGDMFPAEYKNKIFIAEHGSWNRKAKSGYRITMVTLDEQGQALDYEVFAEGWLDHDSQVNFGRPVDLLELPDGSLLVSDDYAGVIYRITYTG
ncbi:MAG: sorbosone dehydrogenase family protein [Cyclobacteriaceae bacterium]|nr:sorbosone dehydrogenase family protein [Cyclobacteriaceae bacterium]